MDNKIVTSIYLMPGMAASPKIFELNLTNYLVLSIEQKSRILLLAIK